MAPHRVIIDVNARLYSSLDYIHLVLYGRRIAHLLCVSLFLAFFFSLSTALALSLHRRLGLLKLQTDLREGGKEERKTLLQAV